MKKRKIHIFVLSSILFFVIGTMNSIQSTAEENGGAVGTKGEIVLQKEGEQPDEPPKNTVDTTNSGTTPTIAKPNKSVKPVGRFPSTGELVITSLSISGIVLALATFVFVFLKRKKQRERGQNNEG